MSVRHRRTLGVERIREIMYKWVVAFLTRMTGCIKDHLSTMERFSLAFCFPMFNRSEARFDRLFQKNANVTCSINHALSPIHSRVGRVYCERYLSSWHEETCLPRPSVFPISPLEAGG